ncbi:MAG: hypothetical protein KF870_13220 [Leadbetterella sp.]|nr:hypothetical protein [Leadbetterella sp.]
MRQVCKAENLKKDISEICDDCPIGPRISAKIESQIIAKARERYDLMPETLNSYIEDECSNAMQKMEELINYDLQGCITEYSNSSLVYIWNKERIKALRRFEKEVELINPKQIPQLFLPKKLDTDRARILFNKAIQQGLIKVNGEYYEWLMESKALLAYFTEIIYCKDADGKDNYKRYPEKDLDNLFRESRLGKARGQIASNKKGGKPTNFQIIDDLVNN